MSLPNLELTPLFRRTLPVNILVVAPNYPYPSYRSSGIFNEKSAYALSKLCNRVEVLVPSPYVPPLLPSLVPRWKAYATVPRYKSENGISVYRPTVPVVPGIAQALWADQSAFLWCRQRARKMHRRTRFDAIISFDLMGAGGVAWRLGQDLQLPASGWATGSDIRVPASSSHGRAVIRTLQNLDFVFYQSHELLEKAAGLLGTSAGQLSSNRHMVLPRGIPEPPNVPKEEMRDRIRAEWGMKADEVVVLYLGRILHAKGMLELLEALRLATSSDPRIKCVLIGSKPVFDDTALIEKKLREIPRLSERVMVLPECSPDDIWDYLCVADIFAFPSHREGMPNSLLEAMAMGVPAVAFAIPAVQELEAGTGGLVLVPPFDSKLFGEAILRLAACPDERARIGESGKALVMDRFLVRKSMAEALRRLKLLVTERHAGENRQIAIQ
jgi:teichuronic acid biosynthesis glycosyltransferase TuaC